MALRAATAEDAIWCGADVITEAEFGAISDARLTRFNYELSHQDLDCALESVREHHPGQTIWVEAAA